MKVASIEELESQLEIARLEAELSAVKAAGDREAKREVMGRLREARQHHRTSWPAVAVAPDAVASPRSAGLATAAKAV